MGRPDPKAPDAHPVALLLPWYVTGKLTARDRRQADEHLATCAGCRTELAALRVLRGQLRESAATPVAGDANARRGTRPRTVARGLIARLAPRRVAARRWLPGAALTVILAQAGVLLWMTPPIPIATDVAARGLSAPATRLQLVLRPTAAEQNLRVLLWSTHARIIAGPSTNGTYLIEVPVTDPTQVEQSLAALRARVDLVRSAERAAP